MARIYYIKRVPEVIKNYIHKKFPPVEGFTFRFYKYFNHDKTITNYGCAVSKNGKLWDLTNQGTIEEFKTYTL